MMASPRPRSTMTLPYSTRLTMPLTMSPMRSLNSWYCRSRSASRTFCTITCLADCAAMRPYSSGGSVSAMVSRIGAAGIGQRNLVGMVLDVLDHQHVARETELALLGVDLGMHVGFAAVAGA